MKTIDRAIMATLAAGIWTAILTFYLQSNSVHALSISADDIDDLEYAVENIVENCSVSGQVYMHSAEYGDIESATIDC
jgi:hypothetical protein